jgi:glucuronokinase
MAPPEECSSRVYARVGLLGNPSDGMEGACVALAISNYSACVTLEQQEDGFVEIAANPEHDPAQFATIGELKDHLSKWGYYGGRRLLSQFQGFVHGSECDWSPIEPDWQTNWVAWI